MDADTQRSSGTSATDKNILGKAIATPGWLLDLGKKLSTPEKGILEVKEEDDLSCSLAASGDAAFSKYIWNMI